MREGTALQLLLKLAVLGLAFLPAPQGCGDGAADADCEVEGSELEVMKVSLLQHQLVHQRSTEFYSTLRKPDGHGAKHNGHGGLPKPGHGQPGDPLPDEEVRFTAAAEALQAAMMSPEGLVVKAKRSLEHLEETSATSASALRWDLPLTLYFSSQGIIFRPERVRNLTRCSYTFDALSSNRSVLVQDAAVPPQCGASKRFSTTSGRCLHASPGQYASSFYKRILTPNSRGSFDFQLMPQALCHWQGTQEMLDAERALLEASLMPPDDAGNMSHEAWKKAWRAPHGGWNEVILGPYNGDDIAGIYWRHPGPFRRLDWTACTAALKWRCSAGKIKVFELAHIKRVPHWDLLLQTTEESRGITRFDMDDLKSWKDTLDHGGWNATEVVRQITKEELRKLLNSGICPTECSKLANIVRS